MDSNALLAHLLDLDAQGRNKALRPYVEERIDSWGPDVFEAVARSLSGTRETRRSVGRRRSNGADYPDWGLCLKRRWRGSPISALASAKRAMLAEARQSTGSIKQRNGRSKFPLPRAHPYYWAGFGIHGISAMEGAGLD